ncbi:hypothetical protein F2P56_029991, partial [Juglans regia]
RGLTLSHDHQKDLQQLLSAFKDVFDEPKGSSLNLSLAYHPQSDGQIEVLNRCLEGYLCCYAGFIRISTPAVAGLCNEGTSPNAVVDQFLKTREQIKGLLKGDLQAAQKRMQTCANKRRTKRHFVVGDWVNLRLQPYRQNSMALYRNLKMSPHFNGPFQVLQKLGSVTYKLDLPPLVRIHPMFHVSCLKRKLGSQVQPIPTL